MYNAHRPPYVMTYSNDIIAQSDVACYLRTKWSEIKLTKDTMTSRLAQEHLRRRGKCPNNANDANEENAAGRLMLAEERSREKNVGARFQTRFQDAKLIRDIFDSDALLRLEEDLHSEGVECSFVHMKWRIPDTSPFTYSNYDSSGFGPIISFVKKSFEYFKPLRDPHEREEFDKAFLEYADDEGYYDENFRNDALASAVEDERVYCFIRQSIDWDRDIAPSLERCDPNVSKYLQISCKHSQIGELMLSFSLLPPAEKIIIDAKNNVEVAVIIDEIEITLPTEYKFVGCMGRDDCKARVVALRIGKDIIAMQRLVPARSFKMLDRCR